jgi:OmpA-like transmembrane domain
MGNQWKYGRARTWPSVVGVFSCALASGPLAADPGSFPNPYANLVDFFRRADGLYLNLDVGGSAYPSTFDGGVAGVAARFADTHTADLAWGLAFGWRFTPNFSSEAGFAALGSTSGTVVANGAPGRFSLAIHGPTVAFIGTVPFDTWEGYVKVGYLFSNADLSVAGSSGSPGPGGDTSRYSSAAFAALGVVYKFDERWYTKLEFQHYQNVGYNGNDGADTININAGTVGLGLRF